MRLVVRLTVFAAALVALASSLSAQTLGSAASPLISGTPRVAAGPLGLAARADDSRAASIQLIAPQGGGQTGSSDGTIGFGIKGGLTFTNVRWSCDESCMAMHRITPRQVERENAQVTSRRGYALGVFFTRPLNGLVSLQPEAMYVQKGYEETSCSGAIFASSCESSATLTYIEVPLLARIGRPPGSLSPYLLVGPSVSILASAKSKTVAHYQSGPLSFIDLVGCDQRARRSGDTCISEAPVNDTSRVDFGLVVAGGIELGAVTMEARYTKGLSNVNSDIDDAGKFTNKAFSILAGFRLR